jgi:hypothetical protein
VLRYSRSQVLRSFLSARSETLSKSNWHESYFLGSGFIRNVWFNFTSGQFSLLCYPIKRRRHLVSLRALRFLTEAKGTQATWPTIGFEDEFHSVPFCACVLQNLGHFWTVPAWKKFTFFYWLHNTTLSAVTRRFQF